MPFQLLITEPLPHIRIFFLLFSRDHFQPIQISAGLKQLTIDDFLPLFAAIRDCLPLFAAIRDCLPLFALFVHLLFVIRYSGFQTPLWATV